MFDKTTLPLYCMWFLLLKNITDKLTGHLYKKLEGDKPSMALGYVVLVLLQGFFVQIQQILNQ